jgi:site-specific DNA-adenine methylase
MDFYCDQCGFQARFGLGMAPHNVLCQVCGTGHMRQGVRPSGFQIVQNAVQAFVPTGQAIMAPYRPTVNKGEPSINQLDYFSGDLGDLYQEFIQTKTVYLAQFNKILLPEPRLFSWLSPYTGNKHNQCHFTQAALAKVAIAQFKANGGVFPRLIEPFVGSGQVFLNSCHWGPSLNQGIPLFQEIIGGDLNPYVVAGFHVLRTYGAAFVKQYIAEAKLLDENLAVAFQQRLDYLNGHGFKAATGQGESNEESVTSAVMSYIYVVNRCVHGSKLNAKKGVTASPNMTLKLAEVRMREMVTLLNVCKTIGKLGATQFACQDFEVTCNLAKSTDIVFMDCPFPNFTKIVPAENAKNQELGSTTANTYGVGDDGSSLQGRIVTVARKLVNQGTTVILCNFANAGLVRAYTDLLWSDTGIPPEFRRWFTFTYCSPATNSQAYLLTILPGRGKIYVNDVPAQLQVLWRNCGGDDNFGAVDTQEFFASARIKRQKVTEPMQQDFNDITITVVNDNIRAAEDDNDEVSSIDEDNKNVITIADDNAMDTDEKKVS